MSKIHTSRLEAEKALREYNNEIVRLQKKLGIETKIEGDSVDFYDMAKYYDVGGQVREMYK